MVKVYYLEKLRKYGNTIGIPLPKKELIMVGQESKWRKGTKVRVLVEILPDEFKEDSRVTESFKPNKKPLIRPSIILKKEIDDPFSSSPIKVFENEIPDVPTKKNVKDLDLKGK